MVKGIEHVAIFAQDTKKLSEWYAKMFDLRLVYDNGKGTYFLAFPSGDMIEFCSSQAPSGTTDDKACGIRHLALTVEESDFDAMVSKLKAEGVAVVADTAESKTGVKTFFFRDIEGNVSHLICRPEPLI